MRKFLIAAAVATSALAAAAPAAAQYYPAPQPYGYGYPQPNYGYGRPTYGYGQPNYGYGYQQPYGYQQRYGYGHAGNHYQLARAYGQHVDQLRNRIERLDRRDRISGREAQSLRREAALLRDYVIRARSNGFSWRERQLIETRLVRLEQRIQYERRDGNDRRYGYYGNDGFIDRDRDGRDDRWERRRERDRDHDDD
jgi:opacity protein-like surface antigen